MDFVRARVVKEYVATSWAELTLRLDEIILIMSQQEDEDNNFARKGWLCGECAGCRGWFPTEFVFYIIISPHYNIYNICSLIIIMR